MFHVLKTREVKVSFLISILVTILFVVVLNHLNHANYVKISDGMLENIKLIATISGTLAGFFITALSILLVLPERQTLSLIKKAGHFEDFPGFMLLCAVYFFLTMLVAFVYIISGYSNYLYITILSFLISGAILNSALSMIILAFLVDYAYQ